MPSENKTQRYESDAFPSLSILGVCGSIGSGKSFACSLLTSKINTLTELSAHHIDTDSLAHGVYAPGSKAIEEIGKEFGDHVIANGTVDRKALGAIVFGDRAEMEVSLINFNLIYMLLLKFPIVLKFYCSGFTRNWRRLFGRM